MGRKVCFRVLGGGAEARIGRSGASAAVPVKDLDRERKEAGGYQLMAW